MPSALNSFVALICDRDKYPIPANTLEYSRLVLADTLATIVGGIVEPEMQNLIKSDLPLGEIKILGTDFKTDYLHAAFLTGTAGTFLEMDEGNQFAKGHPAIHILPAILSISSKAKVTYKEFLEAFVVGYDVAARIGLASNLSTKMHPHGTWGGIGAAAALARLFELSSTRTKELLNIASSLTLATSRQTMLEGGTVRNTYAGISNQMALMSLRLLDAGICGEHDGIKSVFGSVVSDCLDEDKACEKIGKRFEINRNYFKLYSCCRYNHAALDCLWYLIENHPKLKDYEKIDEIQIESYSLAAELKDTNPKNTLAAKFSVPFAIATTLVNRSSGVNDFSNQALENLKTISLCQKVTITENPKYTDKLPDLRPAKVEITFSDGKKITHSVETNRGDWQDPYSTEQIKEKFESLTSRVWSRQKCDLTYKNIMTTDLNDLEYLNWFG
jgi:2-methylcitrate dehydratase PrpD